VEYVKKIIQSDPRKDTIFRTIIEKNQNCWKKFSDPDEVLRWLHNFSNEREIYLALVLANGIMYYTVDQTRYLWRIILMNRVKLSLLDEILQDKLPMDIEKWFQNYLKTKCIFVGYGRASKSGQSMVYPFKQSHSIKDLVYMELFEFLHCSSKKLTNKERVFLLDDFVGSGNQAKREWYRRNGGRSLDDVFEENPHLNFVYLVLVGCKEGKEKIEKKTPMKVILGEELDERFKCFSDTSVIYKDPSERIQARRVMGQKGRMLYKYPLGYDNMQLAIAFCHNTPNNSLPVIWKKMPDGSWHPLFERFE